MNKERELSDIDRWYPTGYHPRKRAKDVEGERWSRETPRSSSNNKHIPFQIVFNFRDLRTCIPLQIGQIANQAHKNFVRFRIHVLQKKKEHLQFVDQRRSAPLTSALWSSTRTNRGIWKISPKRLVAYVLDQTHDLFRYRREMTRAYMTNVCISTQTKNVSFACVPMMKTVD